MNTDLNKSLLESLDNIEDVIAESELNVCFALGDTYAKMSLISEYASEETMIQEYDIFQESSGKKMAKKVKKGIREAFYFITNLIKSFLKNISKLFSNLRSRVDRVIKNHKHKKKVANRKRRVKRGIKKLGDVFSNLGHAIKNGDAEATIKSANACIEGLNVMAATINNGMASKDQDDTTIDHYSTETDSETPETTTPSDEETSEDTPAEETTEEETSPEETTPAEETPADETTSEEETSAEETEEEKIVESKPETKEAKKKAKKAIEEAKVATKEVKKAAEKVKKAPKGSSEYKKAVLILKKQIANLQDCMKNTVSLCNAYAELFKEEDEKVTHPTSGTKYGEDVVSMLNEKFAHIVILNKLKDETQRWIGKDPSGADIVRYKPFINANDGNDVIISIPEIMFASQALSKIDTEIEKAAITAENVSNENVSKLATDLHTAMKSITSTAFGTNENVVEITKRLDETSKRFEEMTNKLSSIIDSAGTEKVSEETINNFNNIVGKDVVSPISRSIKTATVCIKYIDNTLRFIEKHQFD